uniref:BURP domain-containing protein n=2 Tax=Chenopodium quinoa TaxID=63459 RepID=A0A803L4S4_CHEQI
MHNDNNVNIEELSSTTSSSDTLFFIEKNLQVGMKLPQDFQKIQIRPILPKHIVQSFPFAYENFTDILSLFSIKFESEDAIDVKDTLHLCFKRPKSTKEISTCAQSIEEVVDFVVRELGTNEVEVKTMDKKMEVPNGRQDYMIKKVKKLDVPGNNAAVCHRIRYPYTVYYCHHQIGIGHYDVTLVSLAGTEVQTTAICHYDTYAWNPKSTPLRALGLKPGDSPLCHFAFLNDMFWNIKPAVSNSLDMAQ